MSNEIDFERISVPPTWAGRTQYVDDLDRPVWTCAGCYDPSGCALLTGVCQRAADQGWSP